MNHHDDLAAHLAPMEAPLPHPETYSHGYPLPHQIQRIPHEQVIADGFKAWHGTVGGPAPADALVDLVYLDNTRAHGVPVRRAMWSLVAYYRLSERQHPGPITMHEPSVGRSWWSRIGKAVGLW